MSKELKVSNIKTKGADLVVDCLIQQGVTHIFGIPGAKIDSVFDVLQERGPELIVCRHEQNAAFMAAAVGRLTGKPGVCLVTSGPGASNLATGLVTANSESDPVVALAGAVPRTDQLKRTHQSMDNAALFAPITKYSVEIEHPDSIPEAITNAFRSATSTNPGATFVSLPQDVVIAETTVSSIAALSKPQLGIAPIQDITYVVEKIKSAKLPVIFLGMRASTDAVVKAVRKLITDTQLPVVETYQAAGSISRELEDHFFGRVGLFRNQPGDILLEEADLVISIGYDPIEYDPKFWNKLGDRTIIHLDDHQADIDHDYQPERELIGDIALTVNSIAEKLPKLVLSTKSEAILERLRAKLSEQAEIPNHASKSVTHPLQVIRTLQSLIDDETTVTCDIGSHSIWMARCFRSYEPRRLGMQTLGVALPWAIAATLIEPGKKVVSVSGDGGFLFSAMELETAVRLNAPVVHLVWRDGTYDMVAFQQMMKYGRTSATEFGDVDLVKYAESFGAIGLRVNAPEELEGVLKEAMKAEGPVIVDIPIDYRDNIKLSEKLLPNQFN
ncbi:acetolactate synthase AlsS (plasmid) [Bacillus shihchuchen]|uniref:Acetolactate synthase AlsS n=1 Tax=Bacillus shihchuchen TaxID=3036942 RepID=A0ABT7KZ01_9BACI|nr:acetolactate synthase AlsS [Bacillus shihchuchen]